jgi:hypothetical protein
MTVRNMLPSAFVTVSASAGLSLSRLNIPLHMIAVYASWPSSPAPTQHALQGGSLLPYPGRTFTGWTAPASPGALQTDTNPKMVDSELRHQDGRLVHALHKRLCSLPQPHQHPDERGF